MEVAPAVESYRKRETPLQKLRRAMGEFLASLARTLALAALLSLILWSGFLLLDLPVRSLDHLFTTDVLKPGNWLSEGRILLALAPMFVILAARRFGGEEAARAVTAAWTLAAAAVFAGYAYLAPLLEPADLPPARFAAGVAASALLGQYVAAGLYDVLRGGRSWWRAPFYSLLSAYGASAAVYFPAVYWGSGAPWLNWAILDFSFNAILAGCFLAAYRMARRPLRPRGGLGG